MAASTNWGFLLVGVLIIRALLFGVFIKATDFGKPPYVRGVGAV